MKIGQISQRVGLSTLCLKCITPTKLMTLTYVMLLGILILLHVFSKGHWGGLHNRWVFVG